MDFLNVQVECQHYLEHLPKESTIPSSYSQASTAATVKCRDTLIYENINERFLQNGCFMLCLAGASPLICGCAIHLRLQMLA